MKAKTHFISTVGDLANYLEKENLSPEELSKRVNISNMTLRRLLKKNRRTLLPEKYRCLLTATLQPQDAQALPSETLQQNFGSLITELEETGRNCENISSLRKDVQGKLSVTKLGEEFKTLVSSLFKAITGKNTARNRALAIGALLYFLNPVDAIPDALPGIGFLDDFAVLTLVAAMIAGGPDSGTDATSSPK